jgi:uncharacterized coiled-coil DUF342 family protein
MNEMNISRRKALAKLSERFEELTALAAEFREELECLRDEEQEYYDNMPESLQGGEKGEAAQSAVDAMETVLSALEEVESGDFSGLSDL